MVQNAAITGALQPEASKVSGPRPTGQGPVSGAMSMPIDRTPPAPLGAPTPGMMSSPSGGPRPGGMPLQGNSQSDFLSHAGRFSPNRTGLNQLMADQQFRARFPQARVHKNDWIDLGDGSGLIDSVLNFNGDADTGEKWQWLTEAEAIKGKQMEQAGGLQQVADQGPSHTSLLLAKIMQNLNQQNRRF
jgi:hypothetical protein